MWSLEVPKLYKAKEVAMVVADKELCEVSTRVGKCMRGRYKSKADHEKQGPHVMP